MEMNKALKQLVDTKGYEFLKNPMIVNILGDYNAFNEYHSSKIIFKTLVNEGYLEKILFLHEACNSDVHNANTACESMAVERGSQWNCRFSK